MKYLNVTVLKYADRNKESETCKEVLNVDLKPGELIDTTIEFDTMNLEDLNDCVKDCWKTGYGSNWELLINTYGGSEKFELMFYEI